MRVADLEPGKLRYGLMLEEGGVIIDDGTVCALEGGAFYCTVTTSGAERLESWMLDWREAWGLDVFVVNQTASLAAVNVAGPHARDLLEKLCDDPIDKESFPYLRHRRITVNGVSCLAIRLGFVGELAYELHFPAAHAVEMWDAILEAGKEWDIKPFGLDAQRLLRLEKGHIIISQDTDFETTPWKVSMDWAVKLDKPDFVGKAALVRSQRRTPRETLVPRRGLDRNGRRQSERTCHVLQDVVCPRPPCRTRVGHHRARQGWRNHLYWRRAGDYRRPRLLRP